MKTINQPFVTKWDQFNQANPRFRQQIMKQLPTSQMPAIPALQHQTGATMIHEKMRNFKEMATICIKLALKPASTNDFSEGSNGSFHSACNNLKNLNKWHAPVEKRCYILPVTSYVLITFAQFCFYACYATSS